MAADAAERAAEAAEPAAAGTSGAGSSEDGVEIDPAGGYRLDRGRYVQLAIFCGAQFLGSMPWNIFAPIYLISMARWGVGQQRINALSNAWNIYPAPGSMLALWAMERHGLGSALLVGIVAQTVACVLAWVACLPTALPPHGAYALLYFSQAVGATAQPLVFNNIARLSGDWFPAGQRDLAVTAGVLSSAAGGVLVGLLVPAIVTEPAQMPRAFSWQVPLWVALAAAAAVFLADAPEHPPSAAAAAQRERRAARIAAGKAAGGEEDEDGSLGVVFDQMGTVLRDANFMLLAISTAVLVGLGWAFLTLVGQIMGPCGYSNAAAGLVTAVFGAASAAGTLVYLHALSSGGDAREYVFHQRVASVLFAVAALLLLLTAAPGVPLALVVAAWALIGGAFGPLVGPLPIEHGAEVTFPVPANVSTTVLSIFGAVVAFLQVVAGTPLLEAPASADCSTLLTPFAAFALANVLLGAAITFALRADYRRQELERSALLDKAAAAPGPAAGGYGATGQLPRASGGDPAAA